MKETPVEFKSGDLTLEGLMAQPEGSAAVRGAVICHPHPLYGGSMYNNVVDAALDAMWKLGWATLRFNFRGVGASEGEHSGGVGEAEDAAAAINFLQSQAGIASDAMVLAGYSFGAMASMRAAASIADFSTLVLIALPIQMIDASTLELYRGRIVMAAGDRDQYCPARPLEAIAQGLGPRAQVSIVAGADHFFGGYEAALSTELEKMLRATLAS